MVSFAPGRSRRLSRAADRPISGANTLRSRASSRTLPHHQPTRTRASAQAGKRTSGAMAATPAMTTTTARTIAGACTALASAIPTQAARTRSVGQPRSTMRAITAKPGPAAARPARDRFPESHRDPRPSESRRGRSGSPRSSGPSLARCPEVRRAPRPRPSSGSGEPPVTSRRRRKRGVGTRTCVPSASGAARLIAAVSADAVAPPARATASATRLPSPSRYSPGRRTAPATWTTSLGAAACSGTSVAAG